MKRANFWVSILAMAASLATICVIVMPRIASKGLLWVTLALAVAGLSVALVVRRSPTNIASKGREIS